MWSVWPTVGLCLLYVFIVKYAGPRFMKDRQPYQIKEIIVAYNLFQTLFSLWGFSQGWQWVSCNLSLIIFCPGFMLQEITVGHASLLITQIILKLWGLLILPGSSTSQSLLTCLTLSSLFSRRSSPISPSSMCSTMASCPCSAGGVQSNIITIICLTSDIVLHSKVCWWWPWRLWSFLQRRGAHSNVSLLPTVCLWS